MEPVGEGGEGQDLLRGPRREGHPTSLIPVGETGERAAWLVRNSKSTFIGKLSYMSCTLAIPHSRRSSHGEREAESHLSVGEEGERLRALRLVAFDAPLVLLEVAGEALRGGAF